MSRVYKKKFTKVTLYKYEFSQYYSNRGVKITPTEADLTCHGFTIRAEEAYLDKHIKPEKINQIIRSGTMGQYEYVMYSLKNDLDTLLEFTDRMLALANKEYNKACRVAEERLAIVNKITKCKDRILGKDV